MRKIYLTLAACLVMAASIQAQRVCGTTEYMHNMLELDPLFEQNMHSIEQFTQQWIAENGTEERAIVTIPVVVHVVYNTASENISDAQIASQITVLNNDFNKLNSDWTLTPSAFQSLVADVDIEFCIATVNPTGGSTTGIIRKSTTVTSFSYTSDNVKFTSSGGDDAWPAANYLNLWVCDIAGGILGYAQFPGGAASTDGVVCDYLYFGTTGTATAPFNKGRTATHEVGHWLNLYHIWGDDGTGCTGSDLVTDTPNQANENYGCPSFPQTSCSNGANGDMFMNYMDYTDDACMFMFSNGQGARMQALFAGGGARVSLLTSNGCGAGTPTCNVPTGMSTSAIGNNGATLNWGAATSAVSYNVRYKLTSSGTWINTTSINTSIVLAGLTTCGAYEWQVQTVCSAGSSAFTSSTNFSTTGCTSTCNVNYEPNDVLESAVLINTSSNYYSYICPASNDDWFKFSTTSGQPHIKVTLTSLPFDYDIFLYNPSGTLVAMSENAGTSSETIIYNNGPVGSYKVKVIGYGGAFHNTDSYILKASKRSTPYRLDGSFEAEAGQLDAVNAYPNPTNDKVNIVFTSTEETQVTLTVFDMTGREVWVNSFTAGEGENTTAVNLVHEAKGCYTVRIATGVDYITTRICKE
ncbi:MAG: T9SS type A sorting domain-containing protein [Flavobacteriales bacterium]|nr:T9SS type A sorting domain-containing protein [Flavobacteriales bacterium]